MFTKTGTLQERVCSGIYTTDPFIVHAFECRLSVVVNTDACSILIIVTCGYTRL
jgi:hypothetical protein